MEPQQNSPGDLSAADRARYIRERIPDNGLFFGHEWRISPDPFPIGELVRKQIESLGRVLLQFYRASNLLYRQSVEGKLPSWISHYLDQGKPAELIDLQRSPAFKNDLPRVIRPDLLLTDSGLSLIELDSVPGGIGLTAWLNQIYSVFSRDIIGGAEGMLRGFAGIFGEAKKVHIVVSEEAATYRPEMIWMAQQLDHSRFAVHGPEFSSPALGDAVYRFFELFDLPNVPGSKSLLALARDNQIRLTPPPKPVFEEKMLFALFWNRNLESFWHRELGEAFFQRLQGLVPYSWIVDPAPLPPHAAIPELNLTDWHQLKTLSQRQRDLILKISGFSSEAWGARGVYLGADLSHGQWSAAVDKAIASFDHSPYIVQRYHKPKLIQTQHFDFAAGEVKPMAGRVRLCPYYFVHGDGEAVRAHLGGVLATTCPADKKIIHGMKDAILSPCTTT